MEHYSAMKKSKIMSFTRKSMELGTITLSKISRFRKLDIMFYLI